MIERGRSGWDAVPGPLRTAAAMGACLIVSVTALVLMTWILIRLAPLTLAVVAALLLAALLGPVVGLLRRLWVPGWLAAFAAMLLLAVVVAGPLAFVANRAAAQFADLQSQLVRGLARIREYLIAGPLTRQQMNAVIEELTRRLQGAPPDPVAGALGALHTLAAMAVALVLLFFLLRDGARMWQWLLNRFPARRRGQIDAATRAGWETLVAYVRGTVIVAAIDAVGIGLALVVLDVPLALALAFLTFLLAFIPIAGAFLAGSLAVLVALFSNGVVTALLVLAAVIAVQQLEGNLLQPLIIGKALHLHPAVVLVAVSAGTLLGGIAGAVVAVPVTAVVYRIAEQARAFARKAGGKDQADGGPDPKMTWPGR